MNVVAWLVEGGCRLKLGSPPPRSPHHLIATLSPDLALGCRPTSPERSLGHLLTCTQVCTHDCINKQETQAIHVIVDITTTTTPAPTSNQQRSDARLTKTTQTLTCTPQSIPSNSHSNSHSIVCCVFAVLLAGTLSPASSWDHHLQKHEGQDQEMGSCGYMALGHPGR